LHCLTGSDDQTSPVTTRVSAVIPHSSLEDCRRSFSLGEIKARTIPLIAMILAIAVVVGMPLGHATNNVHTLYLGNSTVGSCTGKCENLLTSTGSADIGTSQHVSTSLGKYEIEPDTATTTTTGAPSTSSVSGYAWVNNNDLGGITIQSGTWTFDLTTQASAAGGTPVGSVWITVWNCTTASLGSCIFLFKDWDNTTNVLGTNTVTKNTYTTGSIESFHIC